jgi:hypothetical protein
MAIPYFHPTVLAALSTGGMDAAKAVLDDATRVVLLSAEAANYSDANTNLGTGSGRKVAEITVVPADMTVTGADLARRVRFAGKAGGSVVVAGPVDPPVIAYLDTVNGIILAQLAETSAVTFASGGTLNIPAHDILTFSALS